MPCNYELPLYYFDNYIFIALAIKCLIGLRFAELVNFLSGIKRIKTTKQIPLPLVPTGGIRGKGIVL